jgi:hypothetical protein
MIQTFRPTKDQLKEIVEYANSTVANYPNRNNRRSVKEVHSDIVIGKLGELAYKSWMGNEVSEVDLIVRKEEDPGWDFTKTDGTRVQVKTIRSGIKWVTLGNFYWEELVVIRYDKGNFELEHIKTKTEVNGIAKRSKFKGYYYEA